MRFLGMIRRLWVNGEDYGTIEEHIAKLYAAIHKTLYPDERLFTEPVAEDAPVFLTDPRALPLNVRLGLQSSLHR